jgi:HAE1 family hydrophobic/amphiphilic exporter-1
MLQRASKIGKEIEALLSDLDCEITVNSSTSMMDFSTAFGEKGVSINVYGNDLDMLSEAAAQVASVMSGVTGIESVSDGLEDATPVLIITVYKDKAMAYSLTVAQVYMAVSDALTSTSDASTLEVTDGAYDITVSDPQPQALRLKISISLCCFDERHGQETQVQLADIADISYGQSLNSITRDDQSGC